jgi:hypothetical protein
MRFIEKHRLSLNPDNVPVVFHPLIPLAETWGICYIEDFYTDDISKILFKEATKKEVEELLTRMQEYHQDDEKDLYGTWLAKPDAPITTEYLAFTYLGMNVSVAYTNVMKEQRKSQSQRDESSDGS